MNCACGNAARYVDETGALTCAICPLKAGRDSIRLSDVPALLAWARDYLGGFTAGSTSPGSLRQIVGPGIRK